MRGTEARPVTSSAPPRGRRRSEAPKVAEPLIRPLLTERDILALLKVSRTTLFEYRRRKGFPRPMLLGGSRLRWRPEAVEAWLDDLARG